MNTSNAWKIGTVGRPFPGTVSRIDPNNGELMYSGRHIFAGYMGMEDKTQETIDAHGFMHSGDVVKVSLPNVRNLNLNRSGLFSL